jgi:hypothetical protein
VTGAEESVRARLTALAGEDGWVSSRDELFAQGLFGPLPYHPEALHRVGELVLIAVEGAGFPWDPPGASGRVFLGAHAGLEAVEQLVPCLIWRP